MTQACKSVAHTVAAIHALDLDPIKLKLMDPEEGQGWSREYADQMEVAYKRYLTLLAKFPDETIAPTKDVDKFWHNHILDTMKYAEDCENMFGYFLHHFPYSGLRGVDDTANHQVAGDTFHALYEREFGEPLPQKSGWCTAATPAWCTAAKPAWCTAAMPAWCTAAKPVQESAWCTAAKPVRESAWCTAAKPLIESGTAWCTAARPKLASMA